jgi:hypothetical protein
MEKKNLDISFNRTLPLLPENSLFVYLFQGVIAQVRTSGRRSSRSVTDGTLSRKDTPNTCALVCLLTRSYGWFMHTRHVSKMASGWFYVYKVAVSFGMNDSWLKVGMQIL